MIIPGLFWDDNTEQKRTRLRFLADIPNTGWVAPREFPRLTYAPWISFDTETKDPGLIERGPGWGRGEGHIVGVSVSVPGHDWYFPLRHEVAPEQNLDPANVFAWLRDTLGNPLQPKLAANALYDIGWLSEENVLVKGKVYDVQFAQALLNERGDVNLDHLGEVWLGTGKETSALYQWAADSYGGKADASQRANIYRCPPCLVGPYAEQDSALPGRVLPLQWAQLASEGLVDLFELETDLIPLLVAMRRVGVNVDINRAEYIRDALVIHVKELEKNLNEMVGLDVNVDSNESLQRAFNKLSIPIPMGPVTKDNPEPKPSFTKDTLPGVEHPVADLILTIRKRDKLRSTFIESAILEKHNKGVLHCQFHPLRGDESGTRSGRFSGSNPNLQQVPSRDEEIAPLVRSCFIPSPGHVRWRRYDYEQIEYRWLAHYARGKGSTELRAKYNTDPNTDFHVLAQELVARYTGLTIPRKPIKNFNFGMTFGMGQDKMVRTTTTELRKLGGTFRLNGEELFNAYHEALPFSRETLQHYSALALNLGYITTVLNRRSRFDLWEPDVRNKRGEERKTALPYDLAFKYYGYKIKRAYGHKALNRVLQGSAADLIKKAMVTCWKSGVFDVVGVPRLTVHDELDFSDAGGNDEAWTYVRHVLENAIPMLIPCRAALEFGSTWGDAH